MRRFRDIRALLKKCVQFGYILTVQNAFFYLSRWSENWGPLHIYLSFSDFGEGNAASNTSQAVAIPNTLSAYIWVHETFEIRYGACLDIDVLTPGAIVITGVEVFNPDILVGGSQVGIFRWQAVSEGINPTPLSRDNVCGVAVSSGTGIMPNQTLDNLDDGWPFVDALHDQTSDAFLFGRINFQAIGNGNVDLDVDISLGAGGVLGPPQDIEFGSVSINVILLGDVNRDGLVNLLDIGPFVELLNFGPFQEEADINRDGFVNLLDIDPFIAILTGN